MHKLPEEDLKPLVPSAITFQNRFDQFQHLQASVMFEHQPY